FQQLEWFSSWFGDIKPKARKRTTTTTTTTTQLPQVPILTIVDPMRNPQNWIGILAHHIINQTSTTTQSPLKEIWSRVTSPATTTTTENPDIPRKISYNKYQIWRLKPQDDSQVQALEDYKNSDEGNKLQWLKGPSLRGLTDVLVPPRMLNDFQTSLSFESIDHEVLIFDVGKAIAYEKSKEDYLLTTTQSPKKRHNTNRFANNNNKPLAMTWMRYYEFDDIVTYLENMRMRYPQLVELIHIGRSYEGRPLIVMKIESKEAAAANSANLQTHEKAKLRNKKKIGIANAVFIEGGTHGAEWIAPATATWIINELLKTMKTNKSISDEQSLIRNTTWYIMPVLNPDGYVYSHEYDRFWKKSRSRHISRPSGLINSAMTWLQKKRVRDRVCYGVDLDRNWNYQWGKRGSSRSPCSEFFAGPGPFSEPETKALSEFLMDYRSHIKLYISMQAYGQIISYPYKANTTYDAERLDDFLDVAMVGTDGLRKKGSKTRYKIDSTNDLVENRSGCSDAFVAYDVGIPFSYTMQLADNGVHGYLLPSAAIESTSRDAFEIILAMLDYI
uniref:Peptidase M14 domain-containing protein n=1 Tax=Musca domestica TaxID=7370 RepID=A0A1I8M855_MUSDO